MAELRRYPKRKATEPAQSQDDFPANLLEKACSPLTKQEVEEWQGWVELESEPAFFNIMLRDLGVKDVKTQEIFTIDQSSLDLLPRPVFGLIFLYQYAPGMEEEQTQADGDNQIWFANQTTNNACATVALLNIIMNSADIDLGQRLQAFKAETQDLSTPMRGHSISNNSFIRAIHNSFTRRMDHLNVDLCLENDVSDAAKAAKKRTPANRRKKSGSSRKKKSRKQAVEYGFHFIAYVPSDGYVWELDGLMNNPRKLGPADPNDWTTVARPQIEARMLQYEEEQLSFNLLALCRSPLYAYSRSIATSLAAMQKLHAHMANDGTFRELVSAEEPALDIENETQLAEYHLTKEDIYNIDVSVHHPALKAALHRPQLDTGDAYEIYQQLMIETKSAMGEFRGELMAVADDEQRVKGRRRDYGSALHCWVKKLAEKGVLEDIIKMDS